MRVTSSTYYKDYAKTVQDLHSELNKSMQQVSSGEKYDSAKEDPLAYYSGKKIDNQYNDTNAKNTVISDVNNRLYQQEQGALSIQTEMRTINKNILALRNDSGNGEVTTIETYNTDLEQRLQTMANLLNTSYENFYVYGGNDMTTVPFTLTQDTDANSGEKSFTLNFSHKFPGESDTTTTLSMKYTLGKDGTLNLSYSGVRKKVETKVNADGTTTETTKEENLDPDKTKNYILKAMEEEGRMSLGYGSLENRSTLPDTFTGGLNLLTGLSADGLKAMEKSTDGKAKALAEIDTQLKQTPIALSAKAYLTISSYVDAKKGTDADKISEAHSNFSRDLGDVLNKWDDSEQRISNTYRELGLKQSILTDTQTRLNSTKDTLEKQYKDKLGIDPYDAIVKMYSQQYAYQAAMKVGSNIMQSSLFDFVH